MGLRKRAATSGGEDWAIGVFTDARCFWHSGGTYALLLPVGGLVDPLTAGGLPASPDSKRRFRNLLEVTGALSELDVRNAWSVTSEEACLVHGTNYIAWFRKLSAGQRGELELRTPFGAGVLSFIWTPGHGGVADSRCAQGRQTFRLTFRTA